MSTIKKTTTKASKSPAPATKAVPAKATKKVSAPVSTAPSVPASAASAPAPAPKPVAVPSAGVAPAAAPVTRVAAKSNLTTPLATTISARVDVGFGNTLYLRGEGGSLSWSKGVPMECVSADLWRIALTDSSRAYTFKFLVNDVTWSTGPDFSASAGATVALTPEF